MKTLLPLPLLLLLGLMLFLVSCENSEIVDELDIGPTTEVGEAEDEAAENEVAEVEIPESKPVIALLGGEVTQNFGAAYSDAGAIALGLNLDDIFGDISGLMTVVNPVDVDTVGVYLITYNVTDNNDSDAVEVVRTVNIVDTEIPVITAADVVVNIGSVWTDDVSALDNYDGDLSGNIITTGDVVNTAAASVHNVVYNVVDSSNNSAIEVTRRVSVSYCSGPGRMAALPFANSTEGGNGTSVPFTICNIDQLASIMTEFGGAVITQNFELKGDIDATATSGWNGGEGWIPIGASAAEYSGVFEGNGYDISNLFIDRFLGVYQGLFGNTLNANIQNFSMTDTVFNNIRAYTGIVGGYVRASSISNVVINNGQMSPNSNAQASLNGSIGLLIGLSIDSHVSDIVISGDLSFSYFRNYRERIGLGIGNAQGTDIDNMTATGSITMIDGRRDEWIGGLVGSFYHSTVVNSSANIDISIVEAYSPGVRQKNIGGLIGDADGGTVENCTSQGNIVANLFRNDSGFGGLVGKSDDTLITKSSSSVNVDTTLGVDGKYVGGLVGYAVNRDMENNYATGNVKGGTYVGGLVGYGNSQVLNAYSTGNIQSSSIAGGLVGLLNSTVTNSFSTATITGCATLCGGLIGITATPANSYRLTTPPNDASGIGTLDEDINHYYDPNNEFGFAWDTGIWQFNAGAFPTLK